MPRKYYAYGTYSENGKLYTKDGKEIKNPEKYYAACRKNIAKNKYSSNSSSKSKTYKTTSYKKSSSYSGYDEDYYYDDDYDENYKENRYEDWREVNRRERENAFHAGIEGVEYMSDEEYELFDLGYLTEDDY